jgi:hypothetical protein
MLSELGRREKPIWTSVGESMPVAWVSLAPQNEKRSSQPKRASLHFRDLPRRDPPKMARLTEADTIAGPAGPFRASENLAPLVVGEIERTDGGKANQHQNSTYYDIDNQELTSFSVEDFVRRVTADRSRAHPLFLPFLPVMVLIVFRLVSSCRIMSLLPTMAAGTLASRRRMVARPT